MKVNIDREKCCGFANCESFAEDVFELGPDKISRVLVDEVPADLEDDVRLAADNCPTEAVLIEE
jgi:ferredoxin